MDEYILERFWRLGQRGLLSFTNGDVATGNCYEEDGKHWFGAIDKDGREYGTDEMPAERLPITIVVHSDGRRWIEGAKA